MDQNHTNSDNGSEEDDQGDREKRSRKLRAKAFRIAFEMIFVFAIPAAVGLYLGRFIDGAYSTGNTITFILLGAAFIVSWAIVWWRVRDFAKDLPKQENNSSDK